VGVEGRDLRSVSALHPAIGLQPAANQVIAGPGPSGFAGTYETTLIDWIQLIQMGRRDAVIRILTHDGKVGALWCRSGDIIDATCDGLIGEDAVYRALTWIGGRVSVDFADFSRRRAIMTPTTALLLGAAYREDSAAHDLEQPQSLAAPPAEPGSIAGTAIAVFPTPVSRMTHRPPAWLVGVTCGFLALLLIVRLTSNGALRARQNRAATTSVHDPSVPAAATPGHAAMALPAGRVEGGSGELSAGAFEQIRHLGPTRPITTNAMRKRSRVTKAPAARSVAASSAIDSASPLVAPASVQIIEERPPRIQIIDEHGAHTNALD
jgi:hypothetical protein